MSAPLGLISLDLCPSPFRDSSLLNHVQFKFTNLSCQGTRDLGGLNIQKEGQVPPKSELLVYRVLGGRGRRGRLCLPGGGEQP